VLLEGTRTRRVRTGNVRKATHPTDLFKHLVRSTVTRKIHINVQHSTQQSNNIKWGCTTYRMNVSQSLCMKRELKENESEELSQKAFNNVNRSA
jgi:hypothetical protein